MFKLFIAGFLFLTGSSLLASGYEISDYPHKSRYDIVFSTITDVNTLSEGINKSGLTDDERDYIFSALRRIGELRLVVFKKKVEEMVSTIINQDSPVDRANYRNIFNMSILVIGKIGDNSDGTLLAQFLHDKKEPESVIYLLKALGDLKDSTDALKELNEFTISIHSTTREDIVKQAVDSIVDHNSKSSISFLFSLQGRAPISLRSYINDAIVQLNKTGTKNDISDTNK